MAELLEHTFEGNVTLLSYKHCSRLHAHFTHVRKHAETHAHTGPLRKCTQSRHKLVSH